MNEGEKLPTPEEMQKEAEELRRQIDLGTKRVTRTNNVRFPTLFSLVQRTYFPENVW